MSIAGSKNYTNALEVLESSVLAAQAVHIKDLLAFSLFITHKLCSTNIHNI